eukprot:COSAG02_NODE_36579_length_453_cov_0.607345_1_plen_47_part_10
MHDPVNRDPVHLLLIRQPGHCNYSAEYLCWLLAQLYPGYPEIPTGIH